MGVLGGVAMDPDVRRAIGSFENTGAGYSAP
jgi:hypothetical protein